MANNIFKKLIAVILSILMVMTTPIIAFASVTEGTRPSSGTTKKDPFVTKVTGSSEIFRIPAMVTLDSGRIIAATDARYNGYDDGHGLDTLVSYSDDNGENWHYQTANYLGDNGNVINSNSSAFLDPELTTDGKNVWLMTTLFPGGVTITSAGKDSAFNSDGTLKISNNSGSSFGYKVDVNKFTNGYSNVVNSSGTASGYKIDKYYNLYDSTNKKVGNIFYNQSDIPYSVYRTTYLYVTKSTNGGETWGEPKLLNMKSSSEKFYGTAPGKGVVTSDGTIIMSTYNWNSNSAQQASFVYSKDGGNTWKKGGYLSTSSSVSSYSGENQLVVLDNNTIRNFFRNDSKTMCYADLTKSGDSYSWGSMKSTGISNNSTCMISTELCAQTINGKRVLLVSCPTTTASSTDQQRANGKIFSFLLDDSNNMTLNNAYLVDGASEFGLSANYFGYSCLSNTKDGKIALVYESNIASDISFRIFDPNYVLETTVDFLPQKSTGVMTYSGNRYKDKSYYQITNDTNGTDGKNFSVGYWQYDISRQDGQHVENAVFKIKVNGDGSDTVLGGCSGLNFFSTTCNKVITDGANSEFCSVYGTSAYGNTTKKMGCQTEPDKKYSKTELDSLKGKYLSVDITDGVNRAIDAGQSIYTLIALQPTTSTSAYSDCNLVKNSQSITGKMSISSETYSKMETYVKSHYATFNGYKGTWEPKWCNNNNSVETMNYNNVLYSSTTYSASGGNNYSDFYYVKGKIEVMNANVLLYDGTDKQCYFPVAFESVWAKAWMSSTKKVIKYVTLTNSKFQFKQNWKGYMDNKNSAWQTFAKDADCTEDSFGYSSNQNPAKSSAQQGNSDTARLWKNSVKYTGTGNTENYYDSEKLAVKMQGEKDPATATAESTMYAINYKPVLTLINNSTTFDNKIKDVLASKDSYTPESYNAFIKATYNILTLNPNNGTTYSYETNAEYAVKACAGDIKNDLAAYTSATNGLKRQYTITFKNIAGDIVKTQTVADGTGGAQVPRPLNTSPNNLNYNSQTKKATYTAYTWSTIAKVSADATCNEKAVATDCDPIDQGFTKHNGDVKGYTTYCDKTHSDFIWQVYSEVDWSAYDTAFTVANAMTENTDKYTIDSINSFKNIITSNTVAEDQNTTQQDVETATNNILTAQENLELNKFNVTFNCQYDDQSGSTQGVIDSIETPTDGKYSYGTTITLKLPESFANDGVVQKWTLTNKDKTIQYSSCSTTVSYIVTQDSEFVANVTKAPQNPTESAKVEIKDKNNKVTDIQYVETKKEYPVKTEDRVITVGDNSMTAPKYPYYKVNGFTIGGEVVKQYDKIQYATNEEGKTTAQIIREDGSKIDIKDTTIKPVYQFDEENTKIIIKNVGKNPFTVKVANEEIKTLAKDDTLKCEWDKKVVVHADNAKVWYDGNKIVGYGQTYTFQSNVAVNLRYTIEEKTVDPSTSIESFTYDLYNDKTVAIVGCYILPDDATKKEMGVILSTKVSAQDQIISLGKKYVLTKETSNHQFFFTISRTANTQFTMYAVSYVTYQLNGETKTVYSDVNTCTYIPDAQ